MERNWVTEGWITGHPYQAESSGFILLAVGAAKRFWAMEQTEHNYALRPASLLQRCVRGFSRGQSLCPRLS